MVMSRNASRRVAAAVVSVGTVGGALVIGAAGPAQAVPGEAAAHPPAVVEIHGDLPALPAALGNHAGLDRAPADHVFATDLRSGPVPQWGPHHHHWWRHHHHLWHHWWWWW
ncbi:hypothetical protein [Mycolicibacter hiberniae]|uniref:Uncharacterized protein n=1 Tax=Mycolicibacter hiberniae TaxID=29314 RepID=A0A7I7X1H4_9MYCO|nr:hypothetical protein [Mycolicibacter hiberniae]MCV7087837.1 hypothetical protein [Mycolicibacter hiberniae]ORV66758.1 hypothetical protein AWC09_19440 [Mycolicibacter hiberniae]BBZ23576.1 hypothetical protein MHIB_19940 [Mycolicibacter hiberniae]